MLRSNQLTFRMKKRVQLKMAKNNLESSGLRSKS